MKNPLVLFILILGGLTVMGYVLLAPKKKHMTSYSQGAGEASHFEEKAKGLAAVNDWAGAETELKRAIQAWPAGISAKYDLAEAYLMQGKEGDAYRLYKDVFRKPGTDHRPQVLYIFSELSRRQGDLVSQQAAFDEIFEIVERRQTLPPEAPNPGYSRMKTTMDAKGFRFAYKNGASIPPIESDPPEVVSATRKPDDTLNDDAMTRVYVEVAGDSLRAGSERRHRPDIARETLRKAIALKKASAKLRYKMAKLCDAAELDAEKQTLLNSISDAPGAYTETKFLAQRDLGLIQEKTLPKSTPVTFDKLPRTSKWTSKPDGTNG